jgi:hemerythrin
VVAAIPVAIIGWTKGKGMNDFKWDESLETGDPLVDQQHRDIHQLVAYAEAAKDHPKQLMTILERLMDHVDCHFCTEEALMEKACYIGLDAAAHIAEHRQLTEDAREAVLKFRTGELTSMDPVLEFLRGWLADHVHVRDRKFIDHVRARGAVAMLPEPWASDPPQMQGRVA